MSVTSPPPEQERERPRPRFTSPPAPGRAPSLLDSFNYALEVALGVKRDELILLLLAIAFVLVAEMVNSAIEGAIDVSTTSFDPNAKLAKDIAAGAVLISAVTALAVGYLVFAHAAAHRTARVLDRVRDAPAEITLVALVLVTLLVIGTKAWTGRGTPLHGGLPSGHAAVAFAGWMAATYVAGDSNAGRPRLHPGRRRGDEPGSGRVQQDDHVLLVASRPTA